MGNADFDHSTYDWARCVPELLVSNFETSLEFYQSIGFKIEFDRAEKKFAYLSYQGAQLMIDERHNGHWETGTMEKPFGRGMNLMIRTTEMDNLIKRFEANRVSLYQNKEDAHYQLGQYDSHSAEFLAQDPDGYLLRFNQTLARHKITGSTSHPFDPNHYPWAACVPELLVNDFEESLAFYHTLGFITEYDRPEKKFAYLNFHGSQIMINQRNGSWETGEIEQPFGRGINLQIEFDQIDPLIQQIKDAGISLYSERDEKIRQVGAEKSGWTEFLVQDPDGYLLRFLQPYL